MSFRKLVARQSVPVICAASIAALAVAGGSAFAATKLITGAQILNGSITGTDIKQGSLTGADIQSGTVSTSDLTGAAKDALDGKDGADGAQGPKGDKGDKGAAGTNGTNGAKGDKGDTGAAAPAAEYGVAGVWVKRGAGSFGRWAGYSVALGAPAVIGDSTGGDFRFTCSVAPCEVSLTAAVLSDTSVLPAKVYPRMLIERGGDPNTSSAPLEYCEYADGGVASGVTTLARQSTTVNPFATMGTPLTVNIGGSADCGVAGPGGDVLSVIVPTGYYNVHTSFQFYTS